MLYFCFFLSDLSDLALRILEAEDAILVASKTIIWLLPRLVVLMKRWAARIVIVEKQDMEDFEMCVSSQPLYLVMDHDLSILK